MSGSNMDLALLLILAFVLAYAGLLYYFIYVKKQPTTGPWGKSGIFISVFIIAPIIIIVLWFQSGAKGRLQEKGFTPHPGLNSISGIATGTGDSPTWVFSTDDSESSITEFYLQEHNRDGWSLVSDNQSLLLFEKGNEVAQILVGDGDVIFSIRKKSGTD